MIFVRNVVQRGVEERVVVTEKTPFRIYKRIIRKGERERERKRIQAVEDDSEKRGRGGGRKGRLLKRISSAVLIPRVRTHERNGAVSAARRD